MAPGIHPVFTVSRNVGQTIPDLAPVTRQGMRLRGVEVPSWTGEGGVVYGSSTTGREWHPGREAGPQTQGSRERRPGCRNRRRWRDRRHQTPSSPEERTYE